MFLSRGEVYITLGDYDAAISDFTKVITTDADYAATSYSLRGKSYSLKNDYANALRDFNKSIELSPDTPDFYLERANSYLRQKNYDAAIADATKAMSAIPVDSVNSVDLRSQVVRGSFYCEQGNYNAASSDFNAVLQNKLSLSIRVAYFERGKCFNKKGDYNLAIADFTKLIEIGASFEDLYVERAAAYRKIGAVNLAVADENKDRQLKEARKAKVENIFVTPAAEEVKPVNMGVLNGKARTLVKAAYPPSTRATGTVNVQVVVDEAGSVTSAEAVTGDSSLRQAAENAAKASKFYPTTISGRAVKFTGIIIYNF